MSRNGRRFAKWTEPTTGKVFDIRTDGEEFWAKTDDNREYKNSDVTYLKNDLSTWAKKAAAGNWVLVIVTTYNSHNYNPRLQNSRDTTLYLSGLRRWIDANKRDDGLYNFAEYDDSQPDKRGHRYSQELKGFDGTFPYRKADWGREGFLYTAFDQELWDKLIAARAAIAKLNEVVNEIAADDLAGLWTMVDYLGTLKVPETIKVLRDDEPA